MNIFNGIQKTTSTQILILSRPEISFLVLLLTMQVCFIISIITNIETHSYVMYHKDLTDGWSVKTTIPIQKDPNTGMLKNYTIAYFVMEKEWDCSQYPGIFSIFRVDLSKVDGIVTFYDISISYNNRKVTPTWTTGYVDDVCNCRAKILNSTSLKITWNTNDKLV